MSDTTTIYRVRFEFVGSVRASTVLETVDHDAYKHMSTSLDRITLSFEWLTGDRDGVSAYARTCADIIEKLEEVTITSAFIEYTKPSWEHGGNTWKLRDVELWSR